MYRFMQSLSFPTGASSRTYHLLLAHYLQQEYPSVKDTGPGFSLSALAQDNFSFAPRTGIVVNLQLMQELQRLDAAQMLTSHTFADAVLRSQPNYLVNALLPLLEPICPQAAALRPKLQAQGKLAIIFRKKPCQCAPFSSSGWCCFLPLILTLLLPKRVAPLFTQEASTSTLCSRCCCAPTSSAPESSCCNVHKSRNRSWPAVVATAEVLRWV